MIAAKPIIFLLFCLLNFGIISSATDPGDAAVLTKLRQIWKNTPPNWSNSNDPCGSAWDGIGCSNSRVVGLNLASMGVEGTLVAEIGQLSELQLLDLSFNSNLTGPIPSSIGNLLKLETLSLSGCYLGGSLPQEISNLQNLSFLALNSNNLSGWIPPSYGRLSNLDWFDLGDNRLSGPLPVSSGTTPGLDQLVGARHFHFGQNQLAGTIPENLFNSKMPLIHVLFEGNNFSGPMPSSLGLLPDLRVLRVDRNALTGTVPASIRNLTKLRELNLASNGFTGNVPDLSGMTSLAFVDISNNLFTSSVTPSWILSLPSLTAVLMQYVGLIGELPNAIFTSQTLQELILSNNKLNGTVDLGQTSGSGLQLVDLRTNIITGIQNEPKDNTTTLMLIGNPVCNSQIYDQKYCKASADEPTYSTVSECTNQCPSGEANRPRTCKCSQPYAGTLIFRGPLFRDLRNATRFQRLETDLQDNLDLGENSVSLTKPFFDVDEYLLIKVELFPPEGVFFNRSGVQRLASGLSTQQFKPHEDEWGPYVFRADPFDFDQSKRRKLSVGWVAGIAASGFALFVGLVALAVYAVREKRAADRARRVANPFVNWGIGDQEAGSAPQLNGVHFFSFSEVQKYTHDFSKDYEIGVGGYGQVYKATLPTGEVVAIKRAKKGSMQGAHEFKTEIELLSRVHHINLVRLVGFCYEKGEQMLIYEYIPNGTLSESLYGKLGIQLSWLERLRIALGSARGLAYLHELANPPIIHRDVKTANILLNESFTAKVADFGLSSVITNTEETTGPVTIKGTLGYMDPEYLATSRPTDKSDVYSLGVVMLELLTGKKPIERNRYIVTEVRAALRSPDGVRAALDPVIRDAPILAGVERFVDLALRCVEQFPEDRPTMSEVVKEIESILESVGLHSRSTSMASTIYGESKVAVTDSRHSEWTASLDMTRSTFDSGDTEYLLRVPVDHSSGTCL